MAEERNIQRLQGLLGQSVPLRNAATRADLCPVQHLLPALGD